MVRIKGQSQVLGFAIASRDREAETDAALPAVHQAGVKFLLVSGLFGVIAEPRDIAGWCFHSAGFRSNGDLAVRRGDWPDGGFPILQTNVLFCFGLDLLDGVEFEFNIAGCIGMNDERLAVGFDDGSCQAITIFQSDLVSERCG